MIDWIELFSGIGNTIIFRFLGKFNKKRKRKNKPQRTLESKHASNNNSNTNLDYIKITLRGGTIIEIGKKGSSSSP